MYDVIKFFYRQIKTVGLTERASAIAYNFIMAIPPSFLFLFTLIPSLPFISKKSLKEQLHGIITDIVPAKTYNINLIKFVDSFIDGSKIGLLSFGLILALFFASNAMMGLMRSFNKNYIGFEKRSGLHKRWMAIRLTALIFSLVLGCLLLLITQGMPVRHLTPLARTEVRNRFDALLAAELKLMLRGVNIWWGLVFVGMLVASLAVAAQREPLIFLSRGPGSSSIINFGSVLLSTLKRKSGPWAR